MESDLSKEQRVLLCVHAPNGRIFKQKNNSNILLHFGVCRRKVIGHSNIEYGEYDGRDGRL